MEKIEFVECDTCRAKPGSPILCGGCLKNRETISKLSNKPSHSQLHQEIEKMFDERFPLVVEESPWKDETYAREHEIRKNVRSFILSEVIPLVEKRMVERVKAFWAQFHSTDTGYYGVGCAPEDIYKAGRYSMLKDILASLDNETKE
jgi:hypothetical protein